MRLRESSAIQQPRVLILLILALISAPALRAQNPANAAIAPSGAFAAYLPADALSSRELVGPPPGPDSPRRGFDQAIFLTTRAAAGTPRWALAITDGGRGVLKGFSCAAGVALDGRVPALVQLLTRLRTDLINLTKTRTDPPPYPSPSASAQGTLCIEPKPGASVLGEYPSLQSA